MSGRIYVDQEFTADSQLFLAQEEYRDEVKHLTRVLRRKPGDLCKVSNGRGLEADAEIVSIGKDGIQLKLTNLRTMPEEAVALVLWQAILKPPRMDWLMEKASELGVQRFQPLLTEFVVGAEHPEDANKRMGRWQRLLKAGLKQSGAARLPDLVAPVALDTLKSDPLQNTLSLLLCFRPEAKSPAKIFADCKGEKFQRVILAVGPEGGFSEEEENSLIQRGFRPTSLGRSTLRGETAAIAGCAVARECIDFFL